MYVCMHIFTCTDTHNGTHTHTHTEHRYEYLVEQQPIGTILFKQFCQNNSQLTMCVDFVQALDDLLIVADEKFGATARKIYEDFLMEVCGQ